MCTYVKNCLCYNRFSPHVFCLRATYRRFWYAFVLGIPPGVLNFVFGYGHKAGDALVKHPDVPIVSFTGGTVTATKLRIAAAPYSKKLSLEVSPPPPPPHTHTLTYALLCRSISAMILFLLITFLPIVVRLLYLCPSVALLYIWCW